MNKSYSMILPQIPFRKSKRRRRFQSTGQHAEVRRRLGAESLETRALLAGDVMYNASLPTDVNADGYTSPLDALYVINDLNTSGARSLETGTAPQMSGMFYDVNDDQFLTPVDALLVLNQLNGEGEGENLVQIRLQTTDVDGNPIDSIDVGQSFQLRAFVQDLTAREDGGVFAAYVDVQYDAGLASVAGDITHSASYGNAKSGDVGTPGLMDEVGSIDGLSPLGPNELLFFTVPLTADAAGSLTFVPDPADLTPAHDVLLYGVPQGEDSSIVARDRIAFVPATIDVTGMNENTAPVAVDDAYATDENITLVIDAPGVLTNDTDAEEDPLTAKLIAEPDNGTLELGDDGSFTYTPDSGFSGVDTFTYVANDGLADSNLATVTITVNAVNNAPIAVDDVYAAAVNTTLNVDAANGVLSNDIDQDGDALTAELVTGPANGTLDLASDGSFVYVPSADFVGADTFTYHASDGTDISEPATVTIDVTGETGGSLVRVRLEAINELGNVITTIAPGSPFTLRAFVQDVTPAQAGVFAAYLDVMYDSQLVGVDGQISYGESYPNQQSGNTTVAGLIDEVGAFDGLSPLGGDELLLFSVPMTATESGTAVFTSDPADQLPAHDVLLFNVSTPVPTDQIDYGTFTMQIVAGDPPVAVDDEYQTDEDVTLQVDAQNGLLANDSDPDSETLFAILVSQPDHGSVDLASDGSFAYVPAANFFGTDTFTYRASDGSQTSNLATVTIIVNPIVDVPVAIDDFYQMEDMGMLQVDAENGVLANDIEVDGETLSAVLVTGPENGSVELNADGSFSYTPAEDFVGRDTFTYLATANELESNVATVTIDVGDLAPSTIVGYVYSDTDNDGRLDSAEARYGGVRITLRGSDLFGREVSLETLTLADGSYRFDGILRGDYTVTEFQPLGLLDGKDTIDGRLSLRNDRFIIDLPAGSVVGDYNFGERGLSPEYIRDPYFFASRTPHGMLSMINYAGEMEWYCLDDGWVGFSSVDVELSANHSVAEVTVRDVFGSEDTEVVKLNSSRDARLLGESADGELLRLTGDPEDFGLVPVQAAESLIAAAVDAAFGDSEG